ncbi:MAG: MotA/TolQ/ExbB proton channel family protein [Candidatus Riflebacteria bacterium]|nr:MotA/TolQ/ExbB proton channel family protein [Candidatus Riflebacteria bacterium]
MDKTSVVGTILGFLLITIGIKISGNLKMFFDIPSLFIVFGGGCSALLVAFKWEKVKSALGGIRMAYKAPKEYNYMKLISSILMIAESARKEGILSLEPKIAEIEEPFLARLLQLVVDSVDAKLITEVIDTEIQATSQRHSDVVDALNFLASVVPAFGMIGTIIGLVCLLGNLDDPSSIGPNMAVALVTTFYGTIAANLLLTPYAKKLAERAAEEDMYNDIIGRGVILIASGTNPRIVQEKLLSYLSEKSKEAFNELHLAEELSQNA